MVTLLLGHRWPAVCAVAASASEVVTSASKGAASASKVSASASKTPVPAFTNTAASAAENDTVVVGSLVHLTKLAPPRDDLLPAGSKKFVDDFFKNDKFAKQGFKKSHSSKDADGFGYGQHIDFGKKGGDKHDSGYDVSSTFDDDDAAGSMPKFSKWHFEKKSDNSPKNYHFEDGNEDYSFDKVVGPDFEETEGLASRRSKRKKEPHPSATEYDNYEYADVEEPDDGAPADFEADEGDPEYGALYADADTYDYY